MPSQSSSASQTRRNTDSDNNRSPLSTSHQSNIRLPPLVRSPPRCPTVASDPPSIHASAKRHRTRMSSPVVSLNITTSMQSISDPRSAMSEPPKLVSPRMLAAHLTAPVMSTPRPSIDTEDDDGNMPLFDAVHFDVRDMMSIPQSSTQMFYSPSHRLRQLEEEEKAVQLEKEMLTAQVSSKNNNWAVLHHQEVESRKITPSSTNTPTFNPLCSPRYLSAVQSPNSKTQAFDLTALPFYKAHTQGPVVLPPSLEKKSIGAVRQELDQFERSLKALTDESQTVGARYRVIGELHAFLDDDEDEDEEEIDQSADVTRTAVLDLLVDCIASRMVTISASPSDVNSAKAQLRELEVKLGTAMKLRQAVLKQAVQSKRFARTATLITDSPTGSSQFPRFH